MPVFIGGVFRDKGLADRVVTSLLDAGVPSSEISMVVRERAEEDVTVRDEVPREENEFGSLAIHSAWERLGWLHGSRPPYRDKVSPQIDFAVLAAGPLAIAIGGAQVGATAGGIIGSMANFGFTLEHAQRWYDRIREGEAWVMVRGKEAEADKVLRILEKYRGDLLAKSTRHW